MSPESQGLAVQSCNCQEVFGQWDSPAAQQSDRTGCEMLVRHGSPRAGRGRRKALPPNHSNGSIRALHRKGPKEAPSCGRRTQVKSFPACVGWGCGVYKGKG